MSNAPKYDQQYCKKHNQQYGNHLDNCPICLGEKFQELDIANAPDIMEATKFMKEEGFKL